MRRIITTVGLASTVMALLTTPADAYLDPGSGSMFLQLLLGGFAGVAVILKLYWRRLLTFLGLTQCTQQNEEPTSPPSPEKTTQAFEQPQHHP
ncbi:MAG: hypothetical protein AB7G75_21730 [Candidatus Binatia bacterium]